MPTTATPPGSGPQRERQDQAAQVLYDYVIEHVLCAVMNGDALVTRDIQRFGRSLCFVEGRLLFTLPDLFEFAVARCAREQGAGAPDYKSFRRMLYSKLTNAVLRQRGCVVEVAQSNAQHALSVYRLVPV